MSRDNHLQSRSKEKKAQRDAGRRKDRGKKRKHEESEDAQNELDKDFIPLDADANAEAVDDAPSRSASPVNERRGETGSGDRTRESTDHNSARHASKSPKRRKTDPQPASNQPGPHDSESRSTTKSRFIAFVGNLPYSTTDGALQAHFKKLSPFTLRHRVDPATKKSKGFAFIEFENFDRMKTCLKLYHHSMFDPEVKVGDDEGEAEGKGHDDEGPPGGIEGKKSAKKQSKRARRINVELTAGGGGKAEGRKEKIRVKNVRLEDQRKRRADAEKREREKEGGKKGKSEKLDNRAVTEKSEEQAQFGMHPSRLVRMMK